MQRILRSDLPPDAAKELEGYRFCILSSGRWPKVLAKGQDSVQLGIEFHKIETQRDGYCDKTGTPIKIEKSAAELSNEIGNVDHPDCSMFRIDEE